MSQEIPVSLGTICGGALESEFQDAVQQVVTALKNGEKGSINIAIQLQRMADTTTIVTATYSLAYKVPPVKKAEVCFITDDYHLKAEAPPEKPEKPQNVVMFADAKGGQ